ncbi:MAG: hypothetical protein LBF05_04645 [Tannerella sp.]|nr:hypothetical protein [Tannerella sp.]
MTRGMTYATTRTWRELCPSLRRRSHYSSLQEHFHYSFFARSVATRQSGTCMILDCFLLRSSQSAMTEVLVPTVAETHTPKQ